MKIFIVLMFEEFKFFPYLQLLKMRFHHETAFLNF